MPRTISAPDLAILLAQEHWHWLRVTIENPAGVLTNVSLLQGEDWLNSATVNEEIDRPIAAATIRLRLDTDATSFAPAMGGSSINRDQFAAYAPFLRPGIEAVIEVAVTDVGVSPAGGAWHSLGRFDVDDVHLADPEAELTLRDIGARIMDRWIIRTRIYGSAAGDLTLDEVISQQILPELYGTPPNTDFLYPQIPRSRASRDIDFLAAAPVPAAIVFEYEQEAAPSFQAMRDRALQIGYELRYRFDAADAYRFTLYKPQRDRPIVVVGPPFAPGEAPDWTFNSNQYETITKLDSSKEFVRNFVEVSYPDRASGTRLRVEAKAPLSQAKYQTRWMEITEADDSQVDSAIEAQDLANFAVSDLAEPFADFELEMHLFWPVQLGDVIDVAGNGVYFDGRQRFAVVDFTHDLGVDGPGHGKTRMLLRGKVTGAYKEWFRKQTSDIDSELAPLRIKNLHEIERTATEVTYSWELAGKADEIWLWADTFEADAVTSDPWPTLDSPRFLRLSPDTLQWTFPLPKLGQITYAVVAPMIAGVAGRPWEWTIQPSDAIPILDGYKQTPGASGLLRDLSFYVKDPAALGGTLRAWTNHNDWNDANPDGAIEGTLAVGATPFIADASLVWSTGTSLLDDIRVHPGKGKRIFFEYINTNGVSSGLQSVVLQPGTSPVDEANELVAGIIHSLTPFASGVRPVEIVSSLPPNPGAGRIAYLTTDGRLYRSSADGTTWTGTVGDFSELSGQIVHAQIALNAIQADVIAAGAVTETKIADNSITTPKLVAAAVTAAKIAAGTITANEILAGTITALQIANDTLTSNQIAANAITSNELASNSVISGKVQAGSITASEIASATITATQIAANTITAAKLNIASLASITSTAGIIVSGKLQNALGSQYLDLDASGSSGFLVHPRLTLYANGNAEFHGDVSIIDTSSAIRFYKADMTLLAELFAYVGPSDLTRGLKIIVYYGSDSSTITMARSAGTIEPRLQLSVPSLTGSSEVNAPSAFNVFGKTASQGATDSGGAGFKVLRVPNT